MQNSDVGVLTIDREDEIIPPESELHRFYDIYRTDGLPDFTGPLKKHDIEILFFDRDHPELSADRFLDLIESLRYEYQIVMVTDDEPELEIVRQGVDAFITKPLTQEEVADTIEDLIERVQFSRSRSKFWSLISARETLEGKLSDSELETHEEYAEMRERINSLSEYLRESDDRMKNEAEFVSQLRDIENTVP